MIIVNLDKYSADGFKQSANSLVATSPDNITHARLYYDSFAGTDFIQGAFVVGKNSTLEFDNSGVSFTKYKLFESTDGVTYTENKTYGGTEGRDEFNSSLALDPADYEDYDIPVKVTVGSVEQFVPKTITEIVDGSNSSMNDYYFLRGKLYQDNSLYSGRPFFGSVFVLEETGALIGSSSTYLQNTAGSISNTISDFIYRTGGAKVSTGIYSIQCQTGATTGTAVNGMITALNGSQKRYKFENSVWSVYGSRTIGITGSPIGTISEIQRFSATHIRIKLTGFSAGTYGDYTASIGSDFYINDLVCDILPLPNGPYELSSVDTSTGFLDFLCNSTSGNGSFTGATGDVYSFWEYVETYVPGLVGYVVLDVNHEAQTYYDTGKLIIKTYDTDWVLADDILSYGITLTFKALKIAY
jgi:hypothetical protein